MGGTYFVIFAEGNAEFRFGKVRHAAMVWGEVLSTIEMFSKSLAVLFSFVLYFSFVLLISFHFSTNTLYELNNWLEFVINFA